MNNHSRRVVAGQAHPDERDKACREKDHGPENDCCSRPKPFYPTAQPVGRVHAIFCHEGRERGNREAAGPTVPGWREEGPAPAGARRDL